MTITFGFGRSLFDDRFGLADRLPETFVELPHFPGDNLDPARSDGDLCIQACADDPQVAVHAVRNLARIGFGTVAVRWSQLGFGKTSSTTRDEQTPRNLFGFKDGTMNLKSDEESDLDQPDFELEGREGPLVDPASHVARAPRCQQGGAAAASRLQLRRRLDLDRPPRRRAVLPGLRHRPAQPLHPMQTEISSKDLMQEYVQHTGSALFAVSGGIPRGGYVGQALFA